jgi:RNA polymerase sigma-70 factor (ECF subfamily)
MSGASAVLPLPTVAGKAKAKARVDYQGTDEAALVRRVQARDEIAFNEIVERYQAKVFSIIFGILRNHNDAEDISQQVFTKVYFSIRTFDFRSTLLTWIYKITVNECYDYLRKKKVRKLVYESDFTQEEADRMERIDPGIDRTPAIDETLARRDLAVKLLAKVSEEDRKELVRKVDNLVTSRFSGDYKAAFEFYDKDRKGSLDEDELTECLSDAHVGNMFTVRAWARGVNQEVDKNGDNRISQDEFDSVVKKK